MYNSRSNTPDTPLFTGRQRKPKGFKKTWLIVGGLLILGTIAAAIGLTSRQPSTNDSTPQIDALTINLEQFNLTTNLSGTTSVGAQTTGSVNRVEFYVDDILRQTTYQSPFIYSLDTTALTNSSHNIYAIAYDAGNEQVKSQVLEFTVDNPPPAATIPTEDPSTDTANTVAKSKTTHKNSTNDNSGNQGTTPPPPDTTAPSVPQILGLTASDSWTAKLTWGASTDSVGVTGYRVYRDGLQVGTATSTSYSDLDTTAGNDYTYTVAAIDAAGNLSAESTDAGITLPELNIWSDADIPPSRNDADTSAIELGVKFRAKMNGTITGVRFWKGTLDTGTHIGNLWTTGGSNLATATFSGESTTGWQTVHFSSPIAVTAGTVYVASYHTNVGHYSGGAGYFASAGFDNGYIEALQSGVFGGNNGVYSISGSSTFPITASGNNSNYWIDVTFVPTNGQTATTRLAGGSPGNFQGYPDASTTGVPANTALILHPRDIAIPIGYDDISVSNLDITGNIDTYSNNFTITNSRITSVFFWGVNQRSVASGLVVNHVTITSVEGNGADNGGSDYAVSSASAGDMTVSYTDMSHYCNGVQAAAGTVENSYVHDIQAFIPQGSPDYCHTNAVISGGGTALGLTVQHNTLLNQTDIAQGASSSAGLFADFGTQFGVTLNDNFLAGGAYATYGGNTNSHDMVFTNNKFSTLFWANGGYYGPSAYYVVGASGNVWSGNVWADGPSAGQAVVPAF